MGNIWETICTEIWPKVIHVSRWSVPETADMVSCVSGLFSLLLHNEGDIIFPSHLIFSIWMLISSDYVTNSNSINGGNIKILYYISKSYPCKLLPQLICPPHWNICTVVHIWIHYYFTMVHKFTTMVHL